MRFSCWIACRSTLLVACTEFIHLNTYLYGLYGLEGSDDYTDYRICNFYRLLLCLLCQEIRLSKLPIHPLYFISYIWCFYHCAWPNNGQCQISIRFSRKLSDKPDRCSGPSRDYLQKRFMSLSKWATSSSGSQDLRYNCLDMTQSPGLSGNALMHPLVIVVIGLWCWRKTLCTVK